jgi:hypothetical protein
MGPEDEAGRGHEPWAGLSTLSGGSTRPVEPWYQLIVRSFSNILEHHLLHQSTLEKIMSALDDLKASEAELKTDVAALVAGFKANAAGAAGDRTALAAASTALGSAVRAAGSASVTACRRPA